MGYIRHHGILVTATYDDWAERARAEAVSIFGEKHVSELSEPVTNGTQSFAVFPDGSKEGWATSDDGDTRRNDLVTWLEDQRYDDGSCPLAWVEVQYGDDNLETAVVRSSDDFRKELLLARR